MNPRWKIKFKYSDGIEEEVKLYYKDKQAAYNAWSKNFDVISVEQDTDTSYIDFINRIKDKSELIGKNDKNSFTNILIMIVLFSLSSIPMVKIFMIIVSIRGGIVEV